LAQKHIEIAMITKLQITGKLHYHRKCDFQLSKRKLKYRTLLPLTAPMGTNFTGTGRVRVQRVYPHFLRNIGRLLGHPLLLNTAGKTRNSVSLRKVYRFGRV